MIYITQGHEKSIGLEVFLKSFLTLSSKEQSLFTLSCDTQTLIDNLEILKIKDYVIGEGYILFSGVKLNLLPIDNNSSLPLSTVSLENILNILKTEDILLTLPTSKDQLILKDSLAAGYTEFLRKKYDVPNVSMMFSSEEDHALLITDHIPLNSVTEIITKDLIKNKISNVLDNTEKYFDAFDEVILAGINPHVGENGILGHEDEAIFEAKHELISKYPNINFKGPYSGDTLHFHRKNSKQLLVYMFHDQGLPWFKGKNKVVGLNISLGLPFLRMSVDHGTAFDMYGKGKANYLGCYYLLRSAISAHEKIRE
jgi:4-hydroxythreonine-4-phosphate dehydrogenase